MNDIEPLRKFFFSVQRNVILCFSRVDSGMQMYMSFSFVKQFTTVPSRKLIAFSNFSSKTMFSLIQGERY